MGTTSSTPQTKQLTAEQSDVKYLGDRMPFGDEELYHIYRAYHGQHKKRDKVSFLTDVGVLTANSSSRSSSNTTEELDEEKSERLLLLQAVERKILPPNFGNRLYRTTFLRPQDATSPAYNDYPEEDRVQSSMTDVNDPVDNYTRLARLEQFFEGLSKCGRRGAKATLQVLVSCCTPQPIPPEEEELEKMARESDPFHQNNGVTGTRHQATTWIKPIEFMEIGYRVALASAFLQAAARDDEDVGQFFPQHETQDGDEAGTKSESESLKALAMSLSECCARRRRKRRRELQRGNTMMTSPNDDVEMITAVSPDDVFEWAELVAPLFASSLATLTHDIFFPNRPYPPSRTSFDYPRIPGESTFFHHGSAPLLFCFGCMSSSLSGEFFRLYTSASDGLSFNRLQNALLGYGGPTLLIIQSEDCIFGAFTASAWKESKDFYGNTDCFLYQVLPTTAVFRPTGNGRNFMYCNSYARSRGYDQQAHGIGFGGTVDMPRLFIAESFDNCRASVQDMTFEKGALLSKRIGGPNFEIDNLEVWGVGGDAVVQEALGARSRQRDIRDAAIRKARKVDKAAFLDDFKSGLIESKAFAHREQIRGRASVCVDEEAKEIKKALKK